MEGYGNKAKVDPRISIRLGWNEYKPKYYHEVKVAYKIFGRRW